jgi:hypothetical protein
VSQNWSPSALTAIAVTVSALGSEDALAGRQSLWCDRRLPGGLRWPLRGGKKAKQQKGSGPFHMIIDTPL